MLQRAKITAFPAILAVALLLTPAAVAAPESAAQETPPAQAAAADDHSYLPPWMQPQTDSTAARPTLEAQYLNALGDPLAKPKSVQKPPQKHRSSTLFGLSLGIFGR